MKKVFVTLILFVVMSGLLSCSIAITPADIEGSWKLTKVSGVDWTSFGVVLIFKSGKITYTLGSYTNTNESIYSLSGSQIIISQGSNAGLVDGTYDVSITPGYSMSWSQSGFVYYNFSK